MNHNVEQIRKLNDEARTTGKGAEYFVTAGVSALPFLDYIHVIGLMKGFDAFTEENDPHGEHDFGAFDYKGVKYFWKFDYYDREHKYHSPDPSDPEVTRRVLTLMTASEY